MYSSFNICVLDRVSSDDIKDNYLMQFKIVYSVFFVFCLLTEYTCQVTAIH